MRKLPFLNKRILSLLSLIIAGEAIFFLPFVLARIFRPTFLEVFDLTNTELGTYFSVYGIVALFSYFFGGPLADRFSARYLLSMALWLTGLGGLVMATLPSKEIMLVLYAFFGMTTILLFWAALIRATREWGGDSFQGRAFGWLEGGRGVAGALVASVALWMFSDVNIDGTDYSFERVNSFQNVIVVTSVITLLSGVAVWFLLPKKNGFIAREQIDMRQIKSILKLPSIWLLSVIIVCAYVGYKITDDFALYANEVLGFDEYESASIGTVALWIRAIVAVLVGYLADKMSASKVISVCFILAVIGATSVAFGIADQVVLMVVLNLVLILIGLYGIRTLYFALVEEASIPIHLTGTAVGIVSVVGFTPDIFMGPWMGILLDSNQGKIGHQKVFLILLVFSLIGLMASLLFGFLNRRKHKNYKEKL